MGEAYGTLFGTSYVRDANGNVVVDANGLPKISTTNKTLGKFTPDWSQYLNTRRVELVTRNQTFIIQFDNLAAVGTIIQIQIPTKPFRCLYRNSAQLYFIATITDMSGITHLRRVPTGQAVSVTLSVIVR